MKVRRSSALWFLAIHLSAVLFVLLFPFYKRGAYLLFSVIPSCMMHDFLHLYCPLCGATRAVDALLHFHLVEALADNPLIVAAVVLLLVWYGIAWERLFRGKGLFIAVPKPLSVAITVAVVVFWVARNLLLIVFAVDPMGDLLGFWH